MVKLVIPIIGLYFLLFFTATAQTYIPEIRLYSVKEGLSHRQVNDVLEDHQGFIWVATPSGLNRFDGYTFRVWGREDGLHTDQIEHLFEDAYGFIWVFHTQSSEMIDLIDPRSNTIIPYSAHYGTKINTDFRTMRGYPVLTRDSTLYWGRPKGFITFHPRHGFRSVDIKALQQDTSATFSFDFASAQKTVWGTIHKAGTSAVVEVDRNGIVLQTIENKVGQIMFVRPGRSPEGAVNYYNLGDLTKGTSVCLRISETNKIQRIPSAKLLPSIDYGYFLTTYAPLKEGELVFSDYRIFDQKENKSLFDVYGNSPGSVGMPRAFIVDRSGKLWIGSDIGLRQFAVNKKRFRQLLVTKEEPDVKISCRGILEKEEHLVVNTEGGIYMVNKATGAFKLYPGTSHTSSTKLPIFWYSLATDQSGNLFAAEESAINRLIMSPVRSMERIAGTIFVPWTIFPDSQQRLWIGTYRSGLYVYDQLARQLYPYTNYNGFHELKTAGIVSIQTDRRGVIWLCATTGFYRLDLKKGVTERHWSGGKGSFYLPYDNIYHFYEDAEGVFWLATGGGGLISWDRKSGLSRQFSRKSGLPNNTIYAVYEDNQKHLWLPSDYGIIQFDKTRGNVRRIYLPEDGITYTEFNRISHYRARDSTLYFGSLYGITTFKPSDFYAENDVGRSPLVVTGFQQFEGSRNQLIDRTADLVASNEIIMQPDDRFFNLEFALLTFDKTDRIQYAYKVDDVDDNWNYQNEPRLRLTRLPYGTHILHIKGQAANGLWGRNELTISVRVVRPVYLQLWFLVVSVTALLLLIRLLFNWRTKDLQKNQIRLEAEVSRQTAEIQGQAEKLRQLDELKTRLYTNITHEFRTPLTVIMGMVGEMERLLQDRNYHYNPLIFKVTSLIQRNSENLLRLINQVLDLAKLDSGSMNVHVVRGDIIGYLRYLTESFYSIAQEKKIQLVFYPEITELVMDFDEEKIQIIVYNLLSNALKFTGEAGSVTMQVGATEQGGLSLVKLNVQDTGTGISETALPYIFDRFYQADNANTRSGEGTGIGLALTKELVELMGGQITVTSALGKGTTFTLLLPITHELVDKTPDSAGTKLRAGANGYLPDVPLPDTDFDRLPVDSDKPLLLLIEDNADVIVYMKSLLQTQYQIETASNGNVGIAKAVDMIPDIIISDVMMPEKNGYEVCQTLKEDERTSHIPIILLTAKATQDDKLAGLRLGADAYLQKPFHKAELFVLLEKQIELRRLLQKRYSLSNSLPDLPSDQQAEPAPLSALDTVFLQKIRREIEARLDDPELGVSHLCQAVSLSPTQVFRKLKALTGQNPTLYIRKMRLQKAMGLLTSTDMIIAQIAYSVGFSDPSYFSRAFHEEFGKTPSAIRK